MPLKYRTVILDFDGTVAQSGEGITRSVAWALGQMGLPVPEQAVLDRFIGPPLITSFEDYCGLDREQAVEAVRQYRIRYSDIGLFEAYIYPGIPELLRALKRAGAYVAVASGKPEPFLRRIIARFRLEKFIDAVAGPSYENRSSDKTAQILEVLPEGTDLRDVCMIGDRCFDIDAARKLGVTGIGVGYGFGTEAELRESGADLLCESVEALRSVLLPGEKKPRGRMISFEGTDGSGKSTQLDKIREELTRCGYEPVLSREPGGCPISEKIREILLSTSNENMSAECEALLYAASRIQHVRDVLLPALESGRLVLCDRYVDSSLAYQGYGRELGSTFIRQINSSALSLVEPDCTLQFDIDRETAKQRMAQGAPLDRLEHETDRFFERVARGYRDCAAASPNRIRRIDSGRDIEAIFQDVRQIVFDLILDEGVN